MKGNLKSKYMEEIDRITPEVISFLKELIRTRSYSGEEGSHHDQTTVVGKIFQFCNKIQNVDVFSQSTKENQENIISVLPGNKAKTLILIAHTDTVDAGSPNKWHNGNPFSAEEGEVAYSGNNQISLKVGDKSYPGLNIRPVMAEIWEKRKSKVRDIIYGRGSYDNKASVAIAIGTMMALAGANLGGELIVANTVQEETDMLGAKAFAGWEGIEGWLKEMGYLEGKRDEEGFLRNIRAITLEGSYSFTPIVGSRGAVMLNIKTFGKAAHAATPELGINAVTKMVEILYALSAQKNEILADMGKLMHDELLGDPNFSIGTTIVGGGIIGVERGKGIEVRKTSINAIPDWCEATLDVRLVRGLDYGEESLFESIKKLYVTFIKKNLGMNDDEFSIEILDCAYACGNGKNIRDALNYPLVKVAKNTAEKLQNIDLPLKTVPGGNESSILLYGPKIPTLAELGPGGALSHEVHEFVEKDQINTGMKTLASIVVDSLGIKV